MSPTVLTVVELAVKGMAVIGIAWGVALLSRRRAAATRHAIWLLSVIALLALPGLARMLPSWRLPVDVALVSPIHISAPAEPSATAMTPAARTLGTSSPGTRGAAVAPHHVPAVRRGSMMPARPGGQAQPATALAAPFAVGTSFDLIAWMWVVGGAFVLLPLVVGSWRLARIVRYSAVVSDPRTIALAARAAAAVGLRDVPPVLESACVSVPLTCCIRRPVILVPESASEWSTERWRIVLLHEMGHVKRRDCLTHALTRVSLAIHWFNPLAWIAARHLRSERERACDEMVIAGGTHGPDYAEHLLDMARAFRASGYGAAALAMAKPSELEGRLMAILSPRHSMQPRTHTGLLAAGAFALIIPLAVLQFEQRPSAAVLAERQPPVVSATPPEPPAQPQAPKTDSASARVARPEQGGVPGGVAGGVPGKVVGGVPGGVSDGVATSNGTEGIGTGWGTGAGDPRAEQAPGPSSKPEGKARKLDEATRQSMVAALTGALNDTDAEVRGQAASALGQLGEVRAVPALAACMNDKSEEVRKQAIHALGQLHARETAPALAGAMKDASGEVREQAAFALGQLGDQAAVPVLSEALKDADADVRQQAAFALGQLNAKSAVPALAGALKDQNADVRQQAAFSLGQLGAEAAVPALIEALKDAAPDVREQVAFALGQIGDPRAAAALATAMKDVSAQVRAQVVQALSQMASGDPEDSEDDSDSDDAASGEKTGSPQPAARPQANPRPRPPRHQ
jgi:beta-lactamase regulating signal transducer with metallopeptidase domain